MASAALKQQELEPDEGVIIPGEGEGGETDTGQATERDYDAEARENGWRPKEEFPGDPAKWVDAKTFMDRAEEVMPLLKAQNAKLKRKLEDMSKDIRRATAHFEGAEKRAFEKAKAELEARVEAAIESGDLEAGRTALKEMNELKPEADTPAKATKEEAQEALDDFREANPWYDKANLANATEIEINARLFYDRMCDKHIKLTDELAPAEFFAKICDMTVEKYPAIKGKPARQKPASAVEGTTGGRGGSGRTKSWDNLPDAAKRTYQRFIDKGIGVTSTGDKDKDAAAARAYYAKSHDWEGFQE
jgi:hypothetical protein